MSPLELAAALQPLGGLAFLDSSLATAESISLVAAAPQKVLHGDIQRDWRQLSQHLVEHQGQQGGLIGYVTYAGRYCFGHYPQIYSYKHTEGGGWEQPLPDLPAREIGKAPKLHFQPMVSRRAFLAAVTKAQDYIAAGDIYQVNLSYPLEADWPTGADALAFYQKLRSASPSPQAAFLQLGELQVLSASPELFLKMEGRKISTQPIKGTRPRSADPGEDQKLAAELLASAKEKAELLMITDLLRNDLGQVCEYGTVSTPAIWKLESYAQVHHLVSTVSGNLRPGCSHPEALASSLPGGSITGAPKKRAREIIDELEPHPRGLYTGVIGCMDYKGESRFSIAIRSLIIQGDKAHYHVGSGIVADSDPAAEYNETQSKARPLTQAIEL
jgi:para-aminobenzoate synthetase component I